VISAASPGPAAADGFHIFDRFGRELNPHGLVLVDWEGQIANPALEFRVAAPASAVFPSTATLSANGARLYFDAPSGVGAAGPAKTLSFHNATDRPAFRLAIFPDRDGFDEDYELTLRLGPGGPITVVPIHVLDQDRTRTPDFAVTVDFTPDRTGLFADPAKRAIVAQAAEDWAYFLGDLDLAIVLAGAESTFIWDTNAFTTGSWIANAADYRGFLLYAYGVFTPERRSGGEPSRAGFQTGADGALPLRRSGGYEAEVLGNYNSLGWFKTQSDDDWWVSGNLGGEANDLASIAHHEIGHALFFNPGYPRFAGFKQAGAVDDPTVVDYHGAAPALDGFDHFPGAVDRLSGAGAFGNEYFGSIPRRRWLITRLDLLNARAVGYRLRPTSAFEPLSLASGELPEAWVGQNYSAQPRVAGGIPLYRFELDSGALPPGLELDSFTGALHGTPAAAGTYPFTLRVTEYDPQALPVSARFSLVVRALPTLNATRLDDGRVRLAWSPPIAGLILQETSTLVAPDWTNAPSGTNNPGTILPMFGTRFYRLRKP
jgi:hypothetical protein